MCTLELRQRVAIAACSAFALLVAVGCQNALAQSGLPIRNIQVDVAPLRVTSGDPTASWVRQKLPDQLAKALAARMSPQGGTLVVRIDSLTLGPNKDGWAWDNISGVAMTGGVQWPVRATARGFGGRPGDVRGIQSPTRDATRASAHVLAGQRPLIPRSRFNIVPLTGRRRVDW
jgi:hypothetical protein